MRGSASRGGGAHSRYFEFFRTANRTSRKFSDSTMPGFDPHPSIGRVRSRQLLGAKPGREFVPMILRCLHTSFWSAGFIMLNVG